MHAATDFYRLISRDIYPSIYPSKAYFIIFTAGPHLSPSSQIPCSNLEPANHLPNPAAIGAIPQPFPQNLVSKCTTGRICSMPIDTVHIYHFNKLLQHVNFLGAFNRRFRVHASWLAAYPVNLPPPRLLN